MAEAAVTGKRRAMGLKAQDRVMFTVLHDGTAVMRAKTKCIKDLKGMLKHEGKPVPVSEMRHE